MRRSLVALAIAALAGSTLAFAPAPSAQAETDHDVTFRESGEETVTGGAPGGINLTGFTEGAVRCSSDPDAYCETILLTIDQPVEDTDPDAYEFVSGDVSIDLSSDVPGGDFDFYVYSSDADATRGSEITSSGNAPGCTQLCGTAPDPAGLYLNQCDGADECVDFKVTTWDVEGGGVEHVLIDVVYFAAPSTYTATIAYTAPEDDSTS